jgi:acyl-CoA synthetase (AMP-forming)/AMP-acid ligase II
MNFSVISERLADTFGDREALVNIERKRRYNFREFHLLTNRIVNMMREKLDLRRGDHAVMILDNDNASLMHWFTAMKGEAPLCYANYRDSIEDHTFQVDTVDAKVVFIEADLLESHYHMLRERQITIVVMDPPHTDYPGVHEFWKLLEGVDDSNPNVVMDDRDDIVIMRFTGGTTGRGKCAMYSADNILMCRDSFWALPDPAWSPQSRFLHLAPITHGSGMMFGPTLFKGGCTVTMNQPDLEAWCDNIAAEQITMGFAVPTLLYRLLDMDATARKRLDSLETMFYGAAPMSPSKLAELQDAFGNIFVQVYGSTEHLAAALSMSKADHVLAGDGSHLASAGRPAPGVEVEIMDDDGKPAARGEIGEIWLRSRATVLGYFGSPAQTAAEFENGYWKSGDIGRIDERGFFHIVDRKKDMIISGGFNIYANEVEAALNSHPAVLMSAVVGIPHEEWGEAVHAELMLKDGATVNPDDLIEHVRTQLGGYKTPKTVHVVGELPVSVVGKVLRREVRQKYWVEAGRKVG